LVLVLLSSTIWPVTFDPLKQNSIRVQGFEALDKKRKLLLCLSPSDQHKARKIPSHFASASSCWCCCPAPFGLYLSIRSGKTQSESGNGKVWQKRIVSSPPLSPPDQHKARTSLSKFGSAECWCSSGSGLIGPPLDRHPSHF